MTVQTSESLIPAFFRWHFTQGFTGALQIIRNFLEFLFHFFSIPFLIATLFTPYKRAFRVKSGPGFSFSEFFDLISFNLISRVIGAIVRSVVIFTGIVLFVLTFIAGVIILVLWLPATIFTFPIFLNLRAQKGLFFGITDFQNPRILLGRMLSTDYGMFFLTRFGLKRDEILSAVEERLTVDNSWVPAPVDSAHAIHILLDHSAAFKKFLYDRDLDRHDIEWIVHWYERRLNDTHKKNAFWDRDYLLHIPSIGKTWVYGYTPELDKRTTNLAQSPVPFNRVIGREKELFTIERVLSKRSQANVLLVGETGVGRRALLSHFAHLVEQGRTLPAVEGKRILRLDLENLFQSEIDITQRKTTLSTILEEAEAAGDIILVIDEFDRFVAPGTDRMDVSDVFAHTLARNHLHLISLVSPGAYHQYMQHNTALLNEFEKIEVQALGKDDAMNVVADVLPTFENKNFYLEYSAIKAIVEDTDRLIKNVPFPEKALDLLDQIATDVKAKNKVGAIKAADVHEYIENRLGIPVTLTTQDQKKLLHLEETLHKRVIGQDIAILAVAQSLRRARADVSLRKEKPIGTFLFLGPTGVGKTETAKALAELYFGSQDSLVRFDMSEFQQKSAIKQFLGDFQSGKAGVFVQAVQDHPYAVMLLDELDKADKELLNIFLTALDEGYVTDAFGKKVYLTNMILIATSNAGAEFIRERITSKETDPPLQKAVVEYIQAKGIFSPEFLNRFDGVIVFHPLTVENVTAIVDLTLKRLTEKMEEERGIRLIISPQTKRAVIASGFDPQYGGRSLARAVQTLIENPLSQKILNNTATRGASVTI